MVPSNIGIPATANSKNPIGCKPASTAALDAITFKGAPISVNMVEPCVAKTMGRSNCDVGI